ncbi:MAG: dihydrolipoamide acetyltransferase family protein [Chloroflexota bacterium]
MPTVTMPQLGESVAEGTIGKWLKKVGDSVEKFEPIVEVITDKVNAEVPSPFAGVLTELLVAEGATVPTDAPIAVIEAAGAVAAVADPAPQPAVAAASAPSAPAPAPQPAPAPAVPAPVAPAAVPAAVGAAAAPAHAADEGYSGRMTPAVRRLARENGVDLAVIAGTGIGGRVTREDVLRHVETNGAGPAVAAPIAAPAAAPAAPPVAPAAPSPVAAGDSLKTLSPMRKAIAAHMTRSLGIPAAYLTVEVDMTPVVRRREAAKRDYQAREGRGLSYVAFVTKATVEALRAHPDINAHWTDEGLWRRKRIDVGVAVAVDDGLVVPVIRNADTLSLHGLNMAINDLAERARIRKLKPDELTGGTFTVDNTGWTGSTLTLPIINAPEVAILTMEAIVRRPVVIDGPAGEAIAIRSMMNMVIGFDHRATDGAQAGRFLGDVKRWLEAVDERTPIW